jgi:hypothetical protein
MYFRGPFPLLLPFPLLRVSLPQIPPPASLASPNSSVQMEHLAESCTLGFGGGGMGIWAGPGPSTSADRGDGGAKGAGSQLRSAVLSYASGEESHYCLSPNF